MDAIRKTIKEIEEIDDWIAQLQLVYPDAMSFSAQTQNWVRMNKDPKGFDEDRATFCLFALFENPINEMGIECLYGEGKSFEAAYNNLIKKERLK